jgi:hypothetical protein
MQAQYNTLGQQQHFSAAAHFIPVKHTPLDLSNRVTPAQCLPQLGVCAVTVRPSPEAVADPAPCPLLDTAFEVAMAGCPLLLVAREELATPPGIGTVAACKPAAPLTVGCAATMVLPAVSGMAPATGTVDSPATVGTVMGFCLPAAAALYASAAAAFSGGTMRICVPPAIGTATLPGTTVALVPAVTGTMV